MKTQPKIEFEPLTALHKARVLRWFDKDHVRAFYYGQGLQNTLNNIELYCQGINDNGHYVFDQWIALYDGVPFGFLITTPIAGPYDPDDDYNKWHVAGKKTFTLDLLIGEESFLGKGLARPMIKNFVRDKFSEADFFIIDPEVENARAIHVYKKVGFKKVDEFIPSFNPKPHWMMRLGVRCCAGT